MIRAGIIGGAGYTAGELLRILLNHPETEVSWIHSESNAGNPVTDVHLGLIGECDMTFTDQDDLESIDVLFLCSGHGKSSEYWKTHTRPAGLKVIDLSQDFRDESHGYVYGLPEANRARIAGADLVANPGCYATAIQLGLLPLAAAGLLHGDINVTGITGSTGAGVKPTPSSHFSWRNSNLSIYKPFTHQHLTEIGMTLRAIEKDYDGRITFVPVRGDFARGIFAIITLDCNLSQQEAEKLFDTYYADAAFTHVAKKYFDLKQVVNTNKAIVHPEVHEGKILVATAIDNLLKGASGQAVQNMNIMFGLPEDTGLRLKASAF